MAVTVIDIAEKSGVSRGTVDRVLNNRGKVSPAKRDAVIKAVKELGYIPNPVARALVTGKTGIFGLIVPDLRNYIFAEILGYVCDEVIGKDYSLLTKSLAGFNRGGMRLEEIALWPVDGIIGWDAIHWLPEYLGADYSHKRPVVSVGGYTVKGVDTVTMDGRPAILEGMSYFYNKGARRIALFNCEWTHAPGDVHYDGYMEFTEKMGIEREMIVMPNTIENSRSNFRDAMRDYVKENGCPDAIVCYNDTAAVAARVGIREVDPKAAEEVLLLGYDGTIEAEYQYPPISVIKQPVSEISKRGVELLEYRINNPSAPYVNEVIPATFIGR